MAEFAGRDAVIVEAVRTPIGKGKASGALHDVLPVDLLAHSLTELVNRAGIDPVRVQGQSDVLVDREVAERVGAEPGTKAYGVLSVLIQLYATVETICTVGPQSFFPAPKVHSQVIRLVFQPTPRVALQDERIFQRLVKAAFAQRRKTLRNALRTGGFPPLEDVAERLGIQLQRRGETLSLEEFVALANAIAEDRCGVPNTPPKRVLDQPD